MQEASDKTQIPPVLAGPILRRLTTTELTLWLATRSPAQVRLTLLPENGAPQHHRIDCRASTSACLSAAPRLHYLLIRLPLTAALPRDCWIGYRLELQLEDAPEAGWQDSAVWAPDLCYPGQATPGFILPSRVNAILHGSCRKPHHAGGDGLVEADRLLAQCLAGDNDHSNNAPDDTPAWPSLLMLSGDQIYADDVAGPMLRGIHQLLGRLSVPPEALSISSPDTGRTLTLTTEMLYQHPDCYYRREKLLPFTETHLPLVKVLFGGARKPIFTSANAHNHLISLGEYLACYLLSFSPAPWQGLSLDMPDGLTPEEQALYRQELPLLDAFIAGLPAVRRLMAHLPVAMIFDDHDISDDWNLNRHWEETVYSHPLSRRMIGNGLLAYLINQGWGNDPQAFSQPMLDDLQQALKNPGTESHDNLVETLLAFERWDYEWPTQPPLVVLDTRTRRWRSESSPHKPSGLIDWEAVTDLQRGLQGYSSVLLVSAAPIFGVKLIEVIQRIVTWLGKPLVVDAENWMAHPGTANCILNVFRHPKTPQNFVVLSGDVHYSFVYDITLRGRRNSPDIWQICSSGLRNTFPDRLLEVLDRLNRILYSPRSPLNWLTSRRQMLITPRKPVGTPSGRRLLNRSGIGLVELNEQGQPWRIGQLVPDGKWILFERREREANWH